MSAYRPEAFASFDRWQAWIAMWGAIGAAIYMNRRRGAQLYEMSTLVYWARVASEQTESAQRWDERHRETYEMIRAHVEGIERACIRHVADAYRSGYEAGLRAAVERIESQARDLGPFEERAP